jgi:predicted dehydrogenase
MLRIATIGTWGHLGDPIAEILNFPEAKFVAHARAADDDDIAFVRRLVRDESLPWFDDYHQMLWEIRPDVVILSTRIDRINSIAIEVAEAGCHLICEKPLAITHADLQRLHDVVRSKKVQCISMLGNQRHPVMQAAADLITTGQIGDVVLMNARKSYRWGDRPEWFGRRDTYGGTICWVAVHALEMIHHLSGQEFVSVAAMQSNQAHPDRPECEDNGVLLLQLSGGGHASVSFDYLRPKGATTHGDDWVRIVGTGGVIEASLDRGLCKVITDQSPEHEVPLPAKGTYYVDFLKSLDASGAAPSLAMRRAVMLTHVCLCARDAADKGTVEKIPSTGVLAGVEGSSQK